MIIYGAGVSGLITKRTIEKDNDLFILQAIEFWATIANEEFEINMDEYNEINNEMTNEFYDELVALWDGYSDEC